MLIFVYKSWFVHFYFNYGILNDQVYIYHMSLACYLLCMNFAILFAKTAEFSLLMEAV